MSKNAKNYIIYNGDTRGHTRINWLDSYHTFSFGSFYDPRRMGFRTLRVINDDRVTPGAGFPPHSHRDMEIISYVLEGALEHKDSIGNGTVIYPGDAQIMSAGTGITHSEFNSSKVEPVHFLQIWIIPDKQNIQPRYEQHHFPLEERRGELRLIAAKDGRDGAVTIYQDIELYTSVLEAGDAITYRTKPNRYSWLQIAQGVASLNDESLQAGDGVQINGEEQITIATDTGTEILLFDLA